MRESRTAGFTIITAIYAAAAVIGIALFRTFPDLHIFWRVLAGDVGATVFVYLTGAVFRNASVYDPYWSVAPIIICIGLAQHFMRMNTGVFLLLLAICFWGVRLTINWACTFNNLGTQDWRYDRFKRQYPRAFQLISFLGISLFPTLIVFLCLLPGITFIERSAFNILTLLGFFSCVGAAMLQLVADVQMRQFRRENAGCRRIIRVGLWKHSRHPNYLGEILMWWGVYIIMLSAAPGMWFLCVGPLANTLMFLFVSIPMADKRNREERLGFDEYVKETNSLLPIKKWRAAYGRPLT